MKKRLINIQHSNVSILMLALILSSVFWANTLWAEATSLRSVEELLSVLKSAGSPHKDKWSAVQKIRQHGRTATSGLLTLLTIDEGNARYYAIRALGYIRDASATEALCKILADSSYGPRRYAAIALGQIGDPLSVGALRKALEDISHVRKDALDALVKIGSNEAIKAIEDYHFSNPAADLQLEIVSDESVYALGDTIRIDATLTNISDKSVLLSVKDGQPFGYLVFRSKEGAFIEKVDNGLQESRVPITLTPEHQLDAGATLKCSFTGRVTMWTRGEKDDHGFVPSGLPFLTLNFRHMAFHIRKPGSYLVSLVFKQNLDLIELLRASGVSGDKLQLLWQGKAVSKPVGLVVTIETSEHSQTSSDSTENNKERREYDGK